MSDSGDFSCVKLDFSYMGTVRLQGIIENILPDFYMIFSCDSPDTSVTALP